MITAANRAEAPLFTTQTADGAAANATGTPTGVLYVNGTANGATVTVTNIATGLYKASFTVPSSVVDYDALSLIISATVDGTAAKGRVWSATVADAALSISPIVGEVVPRTFTFRHTAYLGEIADNTITATSTANGVTEAEPLNGIASLSLTVIDKATKATVQQVENAGLDRTDDANGNITWTNNSAMTSSERTLEAYLWDDSGPSVVMSGEILIKYAKRGS